MPTFDTPNSTQTYTVDNIAVVEVFGAGGGTGIGSNTGGPGDGGYVSIEVSGETSLEIDIGEAGQTITGGRSPAGDGGDGAAGGFGFNEAGGGGGATVVTRASDGTELAAAGGGGGASVSGTLGDDAYTGGGGARGGKAGEATANETNKSGEDAEGSGVGGDSADSSGYTPSNSEDGGYTTGGGVTVNSGQKGGGGGGSGKVVITPIPTPPSGVAVSYSDDDKIELSVDNQSAADTFEIEMRRDGGSWVSPAGGPSSVSSGGTYSYGPASDAAYGAQVGVDSMFEFRVRASNSIKTTDWTYSDTVYTTPIPPHNPSVSRPNADTVEVSYTVKAEQATTSTVFYREDNGSGYGSWAYAGDTDEHGRSATGGRRTQTFSVSTTPWMDADSRYQFKIRHENKDAPSRLDSGFVYADYGNEGDVYFEDGFESGDLSAWDATSGAVATTDESDPNAADTGIGGADTGSYFAAFDAEGYVETQLGDLATETDVVVRCALATGSMDNASEYTEVQWYDGSSWNTLDRLDWSYNEQGWVEVHERVPDSWLSADNRVRVIGVGGLGGGDQHAVDRVVVSDVLHEYTQPAAPSGLSLDASTPREIGAAWSFNGSVTDTAPSDVETYFGRAGGSLDGENRQPGLDSITFDGLRDGERYRLEVVEAVHQYRRGSKSTEWDSGRATAETTTILPAPTDLAVSGVTADSAEYAWQAKHNYGDTLVQYKPTDADSWTTHATVARNNESATVTGLRNGEAYDVRIVANTEHTQTEDN
ncbi:hypothetical protein HALG_00046 [Halorubrum virus CGphi46]|uniref:Fibronectin type-III domain-containing protein n=1 Tax=Halorubrum virus CGphi46 TaxID=754066 RepID=R9TQQ1_9CAUD|nr:hypothetical protein HALG_00046 [Halorubrum virus CGphi46]AGN33834.1 hypothetical protein HALG_00046 [Halorubrum virus CGphi46]